MRRELGDAPWAEAAEKPTSKPVNAIIAEPATMHWPQIPRPFNNLERRGFPGLIGGKRGSLMVFDIPKRQEEKFLTNFFIMYSYQNPLVCGRVR